MDKIMSFGDEYGVSFVESIPEQVMTNGVAPDELDKWAKEAKNGEPFIKHISYVEPPKVTLEEKYKLNDAGKKLLATLQRFWYNQGADVYGRAELFDFAYLPVLQYLKSPMKATYVDQTEWDVLMEQVSLLMSPEEHRFFLEDEYYKMDNLIQMELKSILRKLNWNPWRVK